MESQFTDKQSVGFYLSGLNSELKVKILVSKPATNWLICFSGSGFYVPYPSTVPSMMSSTHTYPAVSTIPSVHTTDGFRTCKQEWLLEIRHLVVQRRRLLC